MSSHGGLSKPPGLYNYWLCSAAFLTPYHHLPSFVPHESSVLWYGYVLLTFVICTHSPATRSAKISWLGDGMSVDVAMIGCVGSVDGAADDLLILWFLPPHLHISRCILSVSWVEVLDRWW